ncbi:MAG: nuclear transport factor 2, partial [Piptocephalis tieghemiana]
RDVSVLSFEGNEFKGSADISEKLTTLPFQKVEHRVVTCDAQFSNPANNAIIVVVTGQLLVDEGQQPMQFSQTFQLVQEGESFWVYNDVFRLNYG